MSKIAPEWGVFPLPFLFDSYAHAEAAEEPPPQLQVVVHVERGGQADRGVAVRPAAEIVRALRGAP